jgi:hypothetical protein
MGCGAIRYGVTNVLQIPAASIFRSRKFIPKDRSKVFLRNDVYRGKKLKQSRYRPGVAQKVPGS